MMMNNPICPSCGGQKCTKINDREYRCEYCGNTFVPVDTSNDQSFTQQPSSASTFSQQTSQSQYSSQSTTGKNRVTAAILALLLGSFGAHYFYLGETTKGIVYVVLCWTYIPAILGVIEGIMLLTQTDEDFAIKPKVLF